MMRGKPAVLAVVFDFDEGFDLTLAYPGLILEYVGARRCSAAREAKSARP